MKRIGIIGSGAMGNGIAQVCASAGCEVLVYDHDLVALEKARQQLSAILNRLVAKSKLNDEQAAAIRQSVRYVTAMDEFADRELVIEAVIEQLDVKQRIFTEIENIVSLDCVLATNTSSLSIASIASACSRPERVIGIHFFNPAPLMALVEVIPAVQTWPDLAAKVRAWVESLGKLSVLAKDTPGFIVNRVARPYYGESLRILDEGIADAAVIDHAMVSLGGFRMGPFALMDFIGHDVNYRVTESVFAAFFFDPRYKPSLTQKRLFEAGYLGRKTGRGFYRYTDGGLPEERDNHSLYHRSDSQLLERIFQRVLAMLINEAADALHYGIASKEDLDLAMTKGVNYPKGLLKWADEIGIDSIQQIMDDLYDVYREDRYRLSPLLRAMSKEKRTFYGHKNERDDGT